jgi:hypothetical protein
MSMSEVVERSPATPEYNCIAFAANEDFRWWWPIPEDSYYWPENVPREENLEAFVKAFETLGYLVCDNDNLEHGFEKVAIYVDDLGKPKHAARQLRNGKWISKLGKYIDVEHKLDCLREYLLNLGGTDYGTVAVVLKRELAE